ncbi:hypothetical protein EK904_010270 [Melospiza melodia maxima]|nr:hypothetical protein EK904_010270 [Melospiza melodia maxima]
MVCASNQANPASALAKGATQTCSEAMPLRRDTGQVHAIPHPGAPHAWSSCSAISVGQLSVLALGLTSRFFISVMASGEVSGAETHKQTESSLVPSKSEIRKMSVNFLKALVRRTEVWGVLNPTGCGVQNMGLQGQLFDC